MRSSTAASRSSSSRAAASCANRSYARSPSAGPRHSASADAQELGGARRIVVGERGATLVDEPLEAQRVDALGVDHERVSAARAHEDVLDERPAQVRHVDLHGLDRGGGRPLAPHEVDDAIDGHGLAAVQQEDREHRALTRAPEFDRPTVVKDLQRAEDPELQHSMRLGATLPARLPTYNRLLPLRNRAAGAWRRSGRIGRPAATRRSPCSANHHRPLLAAVATAAALAATAPAASRHADRQRRTARPAPPPERVKVVRVQVDEGLDWGDAGIGAAGMLALVLVGFGGAHAASSVPAASGPPRIRERQALTPHKHLTSAQDRPPPVLLVSHGSRRMRAWDSHTLAVPGWDSTGTLLPMETTIDAVGRIVVPKPLRDALGLTPGTTVDIRATAPDCNSFRPAVPRP